VRERAQCAPKFPIGGPAGHGLANGPGAKRGGGRATNRGRFARPGSAMKRTMAAAAIVLVGAVAAPRERPPTKSHPASADEEALARGLFDLEVTSVSKKSEKIGSTAAAIRVITSEEIRRSGARSLPELLRYVPGLEVARIASHQYAITARGFNGSTANKLLVLLDGRTVYTPLYAGVFWMPRTSRSTPSTGSKSSASGRDDLGATRQRRHQRHHPEGERDSGRAVEVGGGNEERLFGGGWYGSELSAGRHLRIWGHAFDRDASTFSDGRSAGDEFRLSQGGFRFDDDGAGHGSLTIQGDAYDGSERQPAGGDVALSGRNVVARWSRSSDDGSDRQVQFYYDRTNRKLPGLFEERLDTWDLSLQDRLRLGEVHDLVFGAGYRQLVDDVINSPILAFLPPVRHGGSGVRSSRTRSRWPPVSGTSSSERRSNTGTTPASSGSRASAWRSPRRSGRRSGARSRGRFANRRGSIATSTCRASPPTRTSPEAPISARRR